MKQSASSKRKFVSKCVTYGIVVVFYILIQVLNGMGMISPSIAGQLVPICAYVTMAIALNLVVGFSGELSLGHAGFMSVGAFSGIVASMSLQQAIPNGAARLAIAMVVGAVFAGIAGQVLRPRRGRKPLPIQKQFVSLCRGGHRGLNCRPETSLRGIIEYKQ